MDERQSAHNEEAGSFRKSQKQPQQQPSLTHDQSPHVIDMVQGNVIIQNQSIQENILNTIKELVVCQKLIAPGWLANLQNPEFYKIHVSCALRLLYSMGVLKKKYLNQPLIDQKGYENIMEEIRKIQSSMPQFLTSYNFDFYKDQDLFAYIYKAESQMKCQKKTSLSGYRTRNCFLEDKQFRMLSKKRNKDHAKNVCISYDKCLAYIEEKVNKKQFQDFKSKSVITNQKPFDDQRQQSFMMQSVISSQSMLR